MKIGDNVTWFEGSQWHYGIIKHKGMIISEIENIHTKVIKQLFTSKLELYEAEDTVSNYNASTS